jgi:hypothetical protein
METPVVRVEWSARGAGRTTVKALRRGENVELTCRGWRARLLSGFLPKYLDNHSKLRARDFLVQLALVRIVNVCTLGYALGRKIEMREGDDAFVVLFGERRPGPLPTS